MSFIGLFLKSIHFSSLIIALPATIIGLIALFLILLGIGLPSSEPPAATAEDRFIDVRGSIIRYREKSGNGMNVVMLHGFGSTLKTWRPLADCFSCGRIIIFDIIGFGASERPEINYNLETHRLYLLSLMDALHIEKAVLVGSSMGASISAWTAAKSPERVQACVLFAPSAYPGSMHHHWPMGLFYKSGFLNRTAKLFVENFLFEKLFPASLARQALDITATYNSSFGEALKEINQPTLLVWSNGDTRVPFEFSRFYLERIPQALLIERPPSAGHSVDSFDPENTAAIICNFLQRIK